MTLLLCRDPQFLIPVKRELCTWRRQRIKRSIDATIAGDDYYAVTPVFLRARRW
jgi:hypothetical protein